MRCISIHLLSYNCTTCTLEDQHTAVKLPEMHSIEIRKKLKETLNAVETIILKVSTVCNSRGNAFQSGIVRGRRN